MPPFVIIASLYPLGPLRVTGSFLKSIRSLFLSSFDISLTFLSGSMPESSIITGIIFAGKSLFIEFLNCLFFASSNSLRILLSKASCVRAGFKSIYMSRGCLIRLCLIDALADKIIGPLTPKCVKSISPKSSYSFFLPLYMEIAVFLSESP